MIKIRIYENINIKEGAEEYGKGWDASQYPQRAVDEMNKSFNILILKEKYLPLFL